MTTTVLTTSLRRRVSKHAVSAAALVATVLPTVVDSAPGDTTPAALTRPSVTSGRATQPFISDNGRWIVYGSSASNLVANDDNDRADVFIYNRITTALVRASVASNGTEANADSVANAVSAAGRFIAFSSEATNLVAGDTNNSVDVFVHDRVTATTARVSISDADAQANAGGYDADISADGRYVAFASTATDLVSGDTNNVQDIFVRDRQTGATFRVSLGLNGAQRDEWSEHPSISSDGRFVAYASGDIFVHDRLTGATALVDSGRCYDFGEDCSSPSISGDGRFVAFQVDTDGYGDPVSFVHDRQNGLTTPVITWDGTSERESENPTITSDGRYVVFDAWVGGIDRVRKNVYRYDRHSEISTLVNVATDGAVSDRATFSSNPSVSADGQQIAFMSNAANLAASDFNDNYDVFVRSVGSSATQLVSGVAVERAERLAIPSESPAINADGRFVAFASSAARKSLIEADFNYGPDIFVVDRQSDVATRASVSTNGQEFTGYEESDGFGNHYITTPENKDPVINSNGRFVAFESNGLGYDPICPDVLLRNRQLATTDVVSNPFDSGHGECLGKSPSVSSGARYVAFVAYDFIAPDDTNGFGDVYVFDRTARTWTRVSESSSGAQGNAASHSPSISGDGRYVAFTSAASNLVANDTNGSNDVFVHDRQTGTTARVSVRTNGVQGQGNSEFPSISTDGRFVAFTSWAPNLVAGDTNGKGDVFVRDHLSRQTVRVSVRSNGTQGNALSTRPSISGNGQYVAFQSAASNLVAGDTNGKSDVFVHDRTSGGIKRVSVSSDGAQASEASFDPSISADGKFVAFTSSATNLSKFRNLAPPFLSSAALPVVFVHQQF